MISKIYMLLLYQTVWTSFSFYVMISEAVKDTFASIRVQMQIIIISRFIKFSYYISWRLSNFHISTALQHVGSDLVWVSSRYVKTKNVLSCCHVIHNWACLIEYNPLLRRASGSHKTEKFSLSREALHAPRDGKFFWGVPGLPATVNKLSFPFCPSSQKMHIFFSKPASASVRPSTPSSSQDVRNEHYRENLYRSKETKFGSQNLGSQIEAQYLYMCRCSSRRNCGRHKHPAASSSDSPNGLIPAKMLFFLSVVFSAWVKEIYRNFLWAVGH